MQTCQPITAVAGMTESHSRHASSKVQISRFKIMTIFDLKNIPTL